jgi:hypothetical protein
VEAYPTAYVPATMVARAASGRTSFGETFGAAWRLAAGAHEPSFGVPRSDTSNVVFHPEPDKGTPVLPGST